MPLLHAGDAVGLIACSDGLRPQHRAQVEKVIGVLRSLGLRPIGATTIYREPGTPFSGPPARRAAELMRLLRTPGVKAVFDLSGGDSANQILPYLNYDAIARARVPFVGISDLSVINNAIFAQTGLPAFHYRIANLAGSHAAQQKQFFAHRFMNKPTASSFSYRWLRGNFMKGTVIGGNIRCLLKLAGTPYFPEARGRILFLEALGGGPARMASLLAQLDQLSVFKKCAGVLLGTFTEMQEKQRTPPIEELVLSITRREQLPVAKTEQLGHGEDAGCLPIGLPITLP
ncbi:MAG: LD-carboxypeptidase [Sporolactobacillus sp.]|jgi:muramoyltetrapeptide carboxypeptidase LdcA involved in peptidoglycan recycling|nr:LD-carboxypeptidase [Sporolactobacillus sp.]